MANAEVTIYDASTGKVSGAKAAITTPSEIKTSPNEILQLRLSQNQINGSEQIGNDLVVYVGGAGPQNKIVVKDYFNNKVKLVIEDAETGNLSLANAPEGSFTGLAFISIDSIDQAVSGTESESNIPAWVLPVVGVIAAAGIGIAISDNKSDSHHGSSSTNPQPPVVEPPSQATLWEVIKAFVESKIALWKDVFNQIAALPGFKALFDVAHLVGKVIKGGFDTAVSSVKTFFKGGVELFEGFAQKVNLTVKFGVSMVAQGFDFVVHAIKFPVLMLTNPLQAIKELFEFQHVGKFISTVKDYIHDMHDAFSSTISNVFNTWKTHFSEKVALVSDVFNDLVNISFMDLLQLPFNMFSAGKITIGGFVSGFVEFVKFVPEAIDALFNKGGLGVGGFIQDAIGFIGSLFTGEGIIGSIVNTIKDAVGGIFGEGSIIGSIVNTIKDVVGGIFGEGSILGSILNTVTDTVGGITGQSGSLKKAFDVKSAVVEDLVANDTHINLDALLPATETTTTASVAEKPVAVNSTPELLFAMNDQQFHAA